MIIFIVSHISKIMGWKGNCVILSAPARKSLCEIAMEGSGLLERFHLPSLDGDLKIFGFGFWGNECIEKLG